MKVFLTLNSSSHESPNLFELQPWANDASICFTSPGRSPRSWGINAPEILILLGPLMEARLAENPKFYESSNSQAGQAFKAMFTSPGLPRNITTYD